ncbi:hypothetical protein V8F20_011201 [Naviculisporaceae sp. PSN 640]
MRLTNPICLLLGAAVATSSSVLAAPTNSNLTSSPTDGRLDVSIKSETTDSSQPLTSIPSNPFLDQLEGPRPATNWVVEVRGQHVSDPSILGLSQSGRGINILNLRIWNPGWKDNKGHGDPLVPPSFYECFIHYEPKGPGYTEPLRGWYDETGKLQASPYRPHAKATTKNTLCHQNNLDRILFHSATLENSEELKWINSYVTAPDFAESRVFSGYNVNLDWVQVENPWRDVNQVGENNGYSLLTIYDPLHAAVVIPFRDLDAMYGSFERIWIPKRQYRTFTIDGDRRPMNESN